MAWNARQQRMIHSGPLPPAPALSCVCPRAEQNSACAVHWRRRHLGSTAKEGAARDCHGSLWQDRTRSTFALGCHYGPRFCRDHRPRLRGVRAASEGGRGRGHGGGEMLILGLTGSIGMGKSTVSRMFREKGVSVMDSDQVVHDLYAPGGDAVAVIQDMFPDAIVDGGVDRGALSKYVVGNEEAMKRLEGAVHPLVESKRMDFLDAQAKAGASLVVLDVPLLYETGMESKVDLVAVVSANAILQKERVMSRPGMTEEKFQAILGRQVPDEDKRNRADFVIDTSTSLAETLAEVERLIANLSSKQK